MTGALGRSAEAAGPRSTTSSARSPGGCLCGWPTPTRWRAPSGGRCRSPSSTWTVTAGPCAGRWWTASCAAAAALDGERLDVAHEALLTDGRGWPAGWTTTPPGGRSAGTCRPLPRSGSAAAARTTSSTADPARRGPRLGRDGRRRADRRRTRVPRRVESAGRRGAPRQRPGQSEARPASTPMAGRWTGSCARGRPGDRSAGRALPASGRPRHGGGRGDLARRRQPARGPVRHRRVAGPDLPAGRPGFRLRDTPETRDTLLDSLVEHRRVIRTETSAAGGLSASRRRRNGRCSSNEITGQIFSWPVDSPDPPRLLEDAGTGWESWRATAASPTDPLLLTAGTDRSGLWCGRRRRHRSRGLAGAALGGEPIAAVVLPDGRRASASSARTTDARGVAADRGRPRRRQPAGDGVQGVAPGALDDLQIVMSADGSTAVLVDPPTIRRVRRARHGRQVRWRPRRPTATYFEIRSLPTGAAPGQRRRCAAVRPRRPDPPAVRRTARPDERPRCGWTARGVTTGAEGASSGTSTR